MSQYDCQSQFCINYGEFEFCKCKKATRQMKATFVQECRANIKLQKHLEEKDKELKEFFESM